MGVTARPIEVFMSIISEIVESRKHYGGASLVERMAECHTPAISIAVIENLEVSDVFVHGVKCRRTKEKATKDTIFQAASMSKPVFAAAVMRLVERGTLDLDADVSEYLIGYDIPAFDMQKHKVTLRQILSHNAGLNLHGFDGYQHGQKVPTVEQILRGEAPSNHVKLKLEKLPETGHQYSGGGYVLAQKIVTDVCRQEFCELMESLVLSPFSMRRSTFSQPLPCGRLNDFAYGYNFHDLQLPGGYDIMPELSAAGLWTTPSDLARFGIEVMKALSNESACLKKETAELMTKPAYEKSPHGIGFSVSECKKGPTFGHGGCNDGYISNMEFCADDGSGIVVMVNSSIGENIPDEVTDAFMDIRGW